MKAATQEKSNPESEREPVLVDFPHPLELKVAERFPCPMTTLAGVRERLLGQNVLALIEETGDLPWAWNIGLGRAREIRVLAAGVDHFARTGRAIKWDWRRVLQEIFRCCDKPFLTGTHVRHILNCSSCTVMNLIRAEALKPLPGTSWQTGWAGSPLISCESFVAFLETRSLVPLETNNL
jgi:hypothetical protein